MRANRPREPDHQSAPSRDQIAATARLLAPYIRHTPTVEVRGRDFGIDDFPITLKLESLQHSGSFKARGAFANLLMRDVPAVGVDAASSGSRAVEAGRPVDADAGGIAADSLAPRRVGERVFPIARRYVREVVLVSDGEIASAQEALWLGARIVAEPGGAAAFAALHSGRYAPRAGERVCVVISGGNSTAVEFGGSPA
jgi:threonine dehydratase